MNHEFGCPARVFRYAELLDGDTIYCFMCGAFQPKAVNA